MKTILQTCVAAYRVPVFRGVASQLTDFRVVAGDQYFTPNLETVAHDEPWFESLANRFLLKRNFCWQQNTTSLLARDEALIAELNPRILSTWLVFTRRRLQGRRSLFWGHLHGRGQRGAVFRVLRRQMLNLGQGVVLYTHTDARQLRGMGYKKPIWVTQNSCLSREACIPVVGSGQDFIYCGRIVDEKKVDLLIRAFALYAEQYPDSCLQIVGDGPQKTNCEKLATQLNIKDRVRFWGMRSDEPTLNEAYRNCLAAVSPGYVGLSAIQALGKGIPMLVAREEPHAPEIEACKEGHTCLFFPSDDPQALCATMAEVQQQRGTWQARAHEISRFIRANYTVEHMADVLADALRGEGKLIVA